MTKKRITMQDIADAVGVSKVTVSKALKNKDDISQALKDKIMRKADEMGYSYNSAANALKSNITGNIGILVPEIFLEADENFYTRLFKNLTEEAANYDMNLLLSVVKKEEETNLTMPLMCLKQKVDGLICMGQLNKDYILSLNKFQLPTVLVDFTYKDMNIDSIVTNNFNASYEATNYLIEIGHKKIGFLGNIKTTSSILDRYLGYCKALLEHSLEQNENYILKERNDYQESIEIELTETMPTAILCNNDKAAYRLVKTLKKAGYSVPKDISVIGFDDVIHSIISEPQLTTIRVKRDQMAKVALNKIHSLLNNNNLAPQVTTIETEIVHRASVNTYK